MKEDTFKKIQKIVDWWLFLKPDFQGLNDLMHARQQLSGHLFTMATDLATARKSWADAQTMLENKKNQLRVKFASSPKASMTQADYQARANSATLFEMEKKYEALYYGMKHQYDAIVQILETMAQRIAILRREWESKNYTNGV